MPSIKILPDFLINQIAAGEVIERPASVIKECFENSVDAGAKSITLELEEGGMKLIRITDDGKGIAADDMQMAFERHATSKISNQEDLANIHTMGFRGEALASIASVSLCKLTSKQAKNELASELIIEGSETKSFKDCSFQNGTQIEIRNIFYNTPARRKYLKNAATEYRHILTFITQFALSQPNISLKVLHNNSTSFEYPAASNLQERVLQIFGSDVFTNAIECKYEASHMKITGFVAKPALAAKSRSKQFIFVNKRPLQNNSISFAVKEAFGSLIPDGRYPFFVLFLDIDPEFVDVNVHPRKLEVRFLNPVEVFHAVKACVVRALQENILAPKLDISRSQTDFSYQSELSQASSMQLSDIATTYGRYEKFSAKYNSSDALKFTQEFMQERPSQVLENKHSMQPLVQIANSYILAQTEDGIVLIDQHAAHERVLYEKLMQAYAEKKIHSQPLLTPLKLDFSNLEKFIFEQNKNIFLELGFKIQEFGGETFIVEAVPADLIKEDIVAVVKGVLDDLEEGKTPAKTQGKVEKILTSMACRSAIMFGDKLSYEEMSALLNEMEKTENRYTCPHGRPSMFTLTFSELEKKFGRRGF